MPSIPPIVTYTGLRLALFAAAALVLYVAGARSWLLLVLAFLVSGVLSVWVLSRQREAVARRVQERVERAKRAMDERTAAEDAELDEIERDQDDPPRP